MHYEWINRIGILFNLLAGFLIAPELLGLARIAKLESYLKDRLYKIRETLFSRKYNSKLPQFFISKTETYWFQDDKDPDDIAVEQRVSIIPEKGKTLNAIVVLTIWVSIIVSVFAYFTEIMPYLCTATFTISLLCYFYLFVCGFEEKRIVTGIRWFEGKRIISYESFRNLSKLNKFHQRFIGIPFHIFWETTFYSLYSSVYFLFINFSYFIVSKTRKAIEGKDGLKGAIVSIGIILFVLGNIFQLIATF